MKVAAKAARRDPGLSRSPLLDGNADLQKAITDMVRVVEDRIGPLS